jgi:hypothetical protein
MIWCEENMAVTAALERFPAELRDAIIRQNQYLKPQRLKMVNKALAIANQQSVKESRQFFRGYYLALDKGTLKETGEPSGSNYATPIHIAMFCFADFIPRLKNNRELLEWLKLVLGSTQSWSKESSQKRVEKIAQRLDLRLSPLK